ncbi:MAG: GNAT family N-acetyltransferase [Solirubrobacterales bacterium]
MTRLVREAAEADELAAARSLRRTVFCAEQGVDPAAETDGRDHEGRHFIVVEDDDVVATCRVLPGATARLSRMAVQADRRGHGIGGELLAHAEEQAGRAGSEAVALHSQDTVRGFYEHHGYTVTGEPFREQGIDHLPMAKRLA